ncbi:oligosaccharide repeat unit polymerase [Empedobacter falsenii]
MEFGIDDITSLIFLILLFGVIKFIERKFFKFNNYSPVTLLVFPIIVLQILVTVTSSYTNFILPNSKAIKIIIYGMLSFWLGGVVISIFLQPLRRIKVKRINTAPIGLMYVTGILFSIILLVSLRGMLNGASILNLNKTDFAQNGIEAHIGGVIMGYLMFFIVVFWETKIKKKKYLLYALIIIIIFLKIVSGVRGNIILPLIGAVLYLLFNNYIKLKVKNVILIALSVIALFILPTLIFVKDASFDYLVSYFIFYVSAGVLGINGYMNQTYPIIGNNPDYIFTFFINLSKKISGLSDFNSVVLENFVQVVNGKNEYGFTSNVYTLLGDVYINSGYFLGSCYFIVLGAYSYIIFSLKNRSIMLGLLYAFLGASLVLGFFGQYVLHPYFYELQVLFIALHFLSKFKLKI